MKEREAPLVRNYHLGDLGRAGDRVAIVLAPPDLWSLAKWADLEAVSRFEATIDLTKISSNRFGYQASLICDAVQSCVVTLEPVHSHIEREFGRELHFVDRKARIDLRSEVLTLAAADDEAPEE